MAVKVIKKSGSVSLPKVIGISPVDGVKRIVYKTWVAGALVPESEIDPDVLRKLDEGTSARLNRMIARVPSADDLDDQEQEESEQETQDPPSDPPVSETEESGTDYSSWTVEVLRERIGGRGLTIPTGSNKPDLVKILEEDDKKENPFAA